MNQAPVLSKFTVKDYQAELTRELRMRRKVWKVDYAGKFTDSKNQRSYDVMEELLAILEFVPLLQFEKMRGYSQSAAMIIQGEFEAEGF